MVKEYFDSDKQAEEWIDLLKSTSQKTFEVATYK